MVNGDVTGWDLSTVTEAQYMFSYAYNFNRDISAWDVSSVTNMAYMFLSASAFRQDLSAWDVGNVSNMFAMFRFASQFNADLSGWCVSRIATKPLNFDGGGDRLDPAEAGLGHLPRRLRRRSRRPRHGSGKTTPLISTGSGDGASSRAPSP